jgi:hypothetical protein
VIGTLVNIGFDGGAIFVAKSNHLSFDIGSILSNLNLDPFGAGVHINERFLGRNTMLFHYLIKEILVVPPERAAHATYTSVNTLSGPPAIARNEATKGAAKDTKSAALIKSDS